MRPVLFRAVADDIISYIRQHNYSSGTKLPAVKDMCKTFKVSRSTMLKSLEILESCNIITRRHGLGVFVNGISSTEPIEEPVEVPVESTVNIRTVGVLMPVSQSFKPSNLDNYGLDIFEGVERRLRQHDLGCLLRLVDVNDFENELKSLRKQPLDGIIVSHNIPDDVIKKLMELKLPIVCAGRECHIRGIGSVSVDILNSYMRLFKLLEEAEFKKIGIATTSNFPYTEDFIALRNLYMINESTLELVCYDALSLMKHEVSIKKLINKLVKENDLPEIFICDSDWTALRILHELNLHNIKVPEEVKLIGFIGMNIVNHSKPKITSMEFDHAQIGLRSVDLLYKISSKKLLANSEKIPVDYKERETFKFT